MAFQNNIISIDGSKLIGPEFVFKEAYRGPVNGCRQLLQQQMPKLMESMFERLDDALYQMANRAESNQRQLSFFDALREVRKERERIQESFNGHILEGYDSFWQSGPLTQQKQKGLTEELDSEDFSLIENEELEEGLAFNTMISRGENRFYRELYALDQRFAHMAGGVSVDVKSNPLAPAAICQGFRYATRHLSLDIPVKLVIYKQFEREVVDALEGLYNEINSLLAKADVLPKLSRKIKRRPRHAPVATRFDGDARGSSGGNYPGDDAELQAELYSTLQQLLTQRRGSQGLPEGSMGGAALPVVDTTDVIMALSSLQQNSGALQPNTSIADLAEMDVRANLLRAMQIGQGSAASKRISSNDDDAIDVISMLFEFILEDRNLPDAMKALLARLQIPMLKVAIIDKGFFGHKNHPARRLLNRMAQAAVGWTEQRGRAEGGLFAKMEAVVERVLNGFGDDIDLFATLYDEFNEFLQREERGYKVTEQRTAQVTQGKEQLEAARHQVFEEINQRLFGQEEVPEVVNTLLKDGWKDVLLLTYLRKGADSDAWTDALARMDELLWSVQPKADKAEQQQLLKQIPLLLKALRTGLNEISYDQHKMALLFKQLQVCHVDCLKGKAVATVRVKPPAEEQAPATTDEGEEQQVEEIVLQDPQHSTTPAEVIDDEHMQCANNLPIGTWLEVLEEGEPSYRAKLSWRSSISGRCLFVNRKGMKVAEVSPQALATWFRAGNAVVLDSVDVPLIDRAMSAMVKVLKGAKKKAEGSAE